MRKTLKINSIKPSSIIENNYHRKLSQVVRFSKAKISDIIKDYTQAKNDPFYVDLISERFKKALDEWQNSFEQQANEIAQDFVDKSLIAVDRQILRDIKKADLSIKFSMSESMQAKIKSTVQENVSLIRSIPEKYLSEVEGAVMRCISRGNDLKELSEVLEYRYGVARRRAGNIAKDQAKKATATFNRKRQIDLGIKRGVWVHSGMGKDKRHSHVKAGKDKLEFDLDKGAYIDGEYILPGELINCNCTWRAILFNE